MAPTTIAVAILELEVDLMPMHLHSLNPGSAGGDSQTQVTTMLVLPSPDAQPMLCGMGMHSKCTMFFG